MTKRRLLLAFLSGTVILFVLILCISFIYLIIANEVGLDDIYLHFFGFSIIKLTTEENQSFYLQMGAGIFIVSIIGGILNTIISYLISKKTNN